MQATLSLRAELFGRDDMRWQGARLSCRCCIFDAAIMDLWFGSCGSGVRKADAMRPSIAGAAAQCQKPLARRCRIEHTPANPSASALFRAREHVASHTASIGAGRKGSSNRAWPAQRHSSLWKTTLVDKIDESLGPAIRSPCSRKTRPGNGFQHTSRDRRVVLVVNENGAVHAP